VTTANVSGTANISTLVVTANASVAGNVAVTGNVVVTGNVTSATHILTGGTANGVVYLDTTKALTTGSALAFNGSKLGIGTTSFDAPLQIQAITGGVSMRFNGRASPNDSYSDISFYNNANTTQVAGIGAANSGLFLATAIASPITFTTNNAEVGRFDSSGNLLVGTTSTGYTSSGSTYYSPSVQYWINNHLTGTSSGTRYIGFGIGTGEVGSITQNGTTGVLYNLMSDYRLKNDQQPLTGAKDFIMALKPKKWQWWDGSGEGVGFVAHEFMEVAKHSGHGEKDAVDADGKPKYQSIQPSSSEVMANLVAFIQEQQTLITQLTARITALESA